jgi:hypothetical protein
VVSGIYIVGGIERELHKAPANFVECCLVLCSHDKSTCQTNDGKHASWVMEGEHALKKKSPGHGMHQSDVICLTVGWLKDARHSMEYGKNYKGYWTSEMFVKQVCLNLQYLILFYCSLSKRLFQHSSMPMGLDTKHS